MLNRFTEKTESKFSRRSFIKTGLASAAVVTLPGCDSQIDVQVRRNLKKPVGIDDAGWKNVRSQFILDKGITYMNNASLGMPPAVVSEAVYEGYGAISREPLHGKHDLQDKIAKEIIPDLAKTFGAEEDEIVLTRNASEALHLQAIGLELKRRDEVIITTQEHPAGHRPWMFRKENEGVRIKEVFIPSPL
ncbi:MAG: aminotransferase class V-fold PLP-dependent enzyme, partial [Candidatus Marinimicrobia bacterium]|nr:aminotransferase class V-fold PLP-dependent enzyme [Candidatus Neomarinimicrobiota bacterium]